MLSATSVFEGENYKTKSKSRASAEPEGSKDQRSEKIYVGHLPSQVQKRDLEDLFGYYGPILSCEVKHGGFAFIHFKFQKDAHQAVKALNRYVLDNRELVVEFSKKSGVNHTSGCLVCGEDGHWARDCPSNSGSMDIKSGKCFKCGMSGHLAKFCRVDENDRHAEWERDRDYRDRVDESPRGRYSRGSAAPSRYLPRYENRDRQTPIIDYGRERDYHPQRPLPLSSRRIPRSPSPRYSSGEFYRSPPSADLDRYGRRLLGDQYRSGGRYYEPYSYDHPIESYSRRPPSDSSRRIPPPDGYYHSYERMTYDNRRGGYVDREDERRMPMERR